MIFYFSGTGNSRWAAQRLAALTKDEARDLILLKGAVELQGQKQVGLVFPVYAWGVPEPVLDFVRRLGPASAFTFGVCTCGSEAGHAMKKLAALWPLDSSYSLVMPNNYILAADVDSGEEIRRKIAAAAEALEVIAREVNQRQKVQRVKEGALPGLKSGLVNYGFNRFARSTRGFRVNGVCTGCGLCAQGCPAGAITLKEGKPVWASQCFQCMRCINACPERAIQWGKSTEGRGRYLFPGSQATGREP